MVIEYSVHIGSEGVFGQFCQPQRHVLFGWAKSPEAGEAPFEKLHVF